MLHKCYLLAIYLMIGFLTAGATWGLAVVESRTGRPVIREQSGGQHSDYNDIEFEPQRQVSQTNFRQENASHLTITQIESLQREISELRGLVEEQDHMIKQLKKSQQDLYLDLERRLNQAQATKAKPKEEIETQVPKAKLSNAKSQASKTADASLSVKPLKAALRVQPGVPVPPKKEAPTDPKPKATNETATKTPTAFANEKAHYDAAYELVRTKRYSEALTTLENYLQNYPQGANIVNAYYWVGEVYRVRWQSEKANLPLLERAGDAFATITIQFPNHPKAADATLKLGLIEQDKGNLDVARQYFADVREHFPNTAAARLAESRLQQLN